MTESSPLKIIPGRTDLELAEEIKKNTIAALAHVCAVMDEAKKLGFEIRFNLAPDWQGKSSVQALDLVKKF